MKKIFTLVFAIVAVLNTNAQQIFIENFETATVGGNLEGYNEWHVSPKPGEAHGSSPTIAAETLTYAGYASSGVGNVAVIDSLYGSVNSSTGQFGQRISTKLIQFGETDLQVVEGEKIYAAFMVKVSIDSKKGAYRDFFTFEGSATSSMTRGRVFARVSTDGELSFGISKNGTSFSDGVNQVSGLSLDDTHLLVVVYEAIADESNDVLTLYYNPDLTKSEAEQTQKFSALAADVQSDYSATAKLGINIRQRGIGAQIGGIRVAKTWADATGYGQASGVDKIKADNIIKVLDKTIYTEKPGNLKVYNAAGVEVLNQFTSGVLDTNLNTGMYIVRFADESGKNFTSKMLIK